MNLKEMLLERLAFSATWAVVGVCYCGFGLLTCVSKVVLGVAYVCNKIRSQYYQFWNRRWAEKNLRTAQFEYWGWQHENPGVQAKDHPIGKGFLLRLFGARILLHIFDPESAIIGEVIFDLDDLGDDVDQFACLGDKKS